MIWLCFGGPFFFVGSIPARRMDRGRVSVADSLRHAYVGRGGGTAINHRLKPPSCLGDRGLQRLRANSGPLRCKIRLWDALFSPFPRVLAIDVVLSECGPTEFYDNFIRR
jgi:hypothetical protein